MYDSTMRPTRRQQLAAIAQIREALGHPPGWTSPAGRAPHLEVPGPSLWLDGPGRSVFVSALSWSVLLTWGEGRSRLESVAAGDVDALLKVARQAMTGPLDDADAAPIPRGPSARLR